MKKINVFFSTLIIALVLLVIGGATITPAVQFKAMTLKTANNGDGNLCGEVLFDGKGRYVMDRHNLSVGTTYQFFGHDWRLVVVEGNTATFWMADPYAKTYFNRVTESATGPRVDGSNIWTNGYSKTVWTKSDSTTLDLPQSNIRKYLYDAAKTIIDNKSYAKYQDKVVPGYVEGHNQLTTEEYSTQRDVKHLSFAKTAIDQVEMKNAETNELTAYYGLDNTDRLWLPSVGDLCVWNVLDDSKQVIKPNTLKWTSTTVSGNYAWLRNPDSNSSEYALVISPEAYKEDGEAYATYFHSQWVYNEAGVRPAIHLDIKNISTEYQEHLYDFSGNNGAGWWSDDWLKALFLTVCIVGVVGLTLVVVAVIVKVRKADKAK